MTEEKAVPWYWKHEPVKMVIYPMAKVDIILPVRNIPMLKQLQEWANDEDRI